jgi:GNAT superfamily N-acetyltransferase
MSGEIERGAAGTDRDAGTDVPALAVRVRRAEPLDLPRVWDLVVEFAAFEKLEHLATGSGERLAAHVFGDGWPRVECLIAEVDSEIAGYAIFYGGFSSFWTKPLVWLEDLFVPERFRGRGVGRALFAAVARVAEERGSPHLDWAVLDWNAPAIEFYRGLGAVVNTGWHGYRLPAARLAAIAREAPDFK